ncbi:asparagine synthase-related protein [Streptomyces sp. NPDC046939]|uniref:asparagine synthase-related protein n=1 Tax=Streptomyces sp. NPDC046939 TaxID=3155376 RepID=UPI0033FDDAC6
MPGRHQHDCFVVLPDTDAGRAAAGPLLPSGAPDDGTRVLRYPSGRPWLVARTPLRRLSSAGGAADDTAVVVIGPDAPPASELAADLRAARGDAALHGRLARRLPGVHHVISRTGSETWVRGTASGLRRVYVTDGPGPRLVSDRPAVLAGLTGAALDETALALRLLDFLPYPLSGRPVWRGVSETDPAYALVLRPDGTTATRRWWHAPDAELPLGDGGARLADALDRSVRAHLSGRARVSAELSGGLDSTSLAFLARRTAPEQLTLVTVASREAHAEDETWARRAVELARATQGALTHHVVPADEAPLFYAGVGDPPGPGGDGLTDEPLPVAPARARARMLLARAAAAGSECHLTGYGGDELFMGLPAASGDLFPRHPLAAWNRVGAVRHQLGWPLAATTRALLTRPSFPRWLAGAVTDEAAPTARTPQLSWGVRQTLPPWLTPDARALVHDAFRTAAAGAEPLAPRPGRHLDLDTIRIGARHFQAMEEYGLALGLPVAAPMYADHVIEATLAVRLADRIDPGRYKPLLAEAVRDVVPAPLLARTTKDHMNGDHTQGLVHHADELRRLWAPDASRLAALGLVDVGRLDALAADPYSPLHTRHSIDATVACEMWLRAVAPADAHRKVPTP